MTQREIIAAIRLLFLAFDEPKVSFVKKNQNWEVKATFVMDAVLAHEVMTLVTIGGRVSREPDLFEEAEKLGEELGEEVVG